MADARVRKAAPEFCGNSIAAPLGLKRLTGVPGVLGETPLQVGSFEVVDVVSSAAENGNRSSAKSRGGIGFVDIAPDSPWSHRLRALRGGIGYTTFTVFASIDTIIDVDGAMIGLLPGADGELSSVVSGQADKNGIQWRSLGYGVETRPFEGRNFAILAVITVFIDRNAGVWWIAVGDHLLAYDLPLVVAPKLRGGRAITINAGKEGAWITDLACSDGNPLFEDENHNAVADGFEREMFGQLLRRTASVEARQALEQAWRERHYDAPQAFQLRLPPPDPLTPLERRRAHGQPVLGDPTSILIDKTLN